MRTQPQDIIARLEADNSRLAKEAVLAEAMAEGLDEFFEGLRMCLDKLYTFGVKQVPEKDVNEGQGLTWDVFQDLAHDLNARVLTGHSARDAIQLCMDVATQEQWNGFYRRILIKDLRCGVSEKTVNSVAKKLNKPDYAVPVFTCQLAHDSANHEKKMAGEKQIEVKLDGVRVITIIQGDKVEMFSRNGKQFHNFGHIIEEMLLFLTRMAGHSVTDEQKVCEVNGIKGHMDCKIDGIVTDVKSVSTYGFKKFKDRSLAIDDPFGYIDQIKGYAYSENEREFGWLAMDKQNGHLTYLKYDLDNESDPMHEFYSPCIVERIRHVKKLVAEPTPPLRFCYDLLEDGKSGNLKLATGCSYCQFKHTCYPDLRGFYYSTGVRWLAKVENEPKVPEIGGKDDDF